MFIKRMEEVGEEVWFKIVKQVSLPVLDTLWMEHLTYMDYLRSGVGLRGYASRDPLVEYKNEGHVAFEKMVANVYSTIAERLEKLKIEQAPKENIQTMQGIDESKIEYKKPETEVGIKQESREVKRPTKVRVAGGEVANIKQVTSSNGKVGRNDLCPCGSGLKYKKCGMINSPEHKY